ncbi:MAG: CvpA family protein [Candidatus Margulisiibacteriota bacterium]|nr:CvpA family protein [Candidatus Margulisiibacteriota bacterium]
MFDLIVGFVIFCFIFLGTREGIVKSLASVVLVFASLFLASYAIAILSGGAPRFSDPSYAGTIGLFFLIWIVTYIFFDILLMFLIRKIVKVIVLGPVDIIGGMFVGGGKGFLICGIIIQMVLSLPISEATREQALNSILSRLSLSSYKLTYPYFRGLAPKRFFTNIDEINLMERLGSPKARYLDVEKRETPDVLLRDATIFQRNILDRERKLQKLIDQRKLIPDVPPGLTKEVK